MNSKGLDQKPGRLKPLRGLKPLRLESSTLFGFVLAFGGVYAALTLQGGRIEDLLQLPAALLVVGGTAGAVLVTMPLKSIQEALRKARALFVEDRIDAIESVELITRLVKKVRRSGLTSLEQDIESIQIPLLKRALRLAADGLAAPVVSDYMRLEIRITRKHLERHARVFEAAGGYAPTLGIIGAVLGLIQVMKHLDQIAMVGHGIAEAFVSTVYGLAFANLILLPIAGRLRASAAQWVEAQELLTDGVASLIERMHPFILETRLGPYIGQQQSSSPPVPPMAPTNSEAA
jgi:chemotaxis protein MotA